MVFSLYLLKAHIPSGGVTLVILLKYMTVMVKMEWVGDQKGAEKYVIAVSGL